ncbi:hypothetical protein GOP47_0027869 [Adiantum capillus-veneris]|nr:hypothetical protein GOP47_0027869 [Adiantum capillus-veneris]
MYPASMRRVESWIKALAEMNVETSLLSEVEDSGTEVESELDLIWFSLDARLSPKKNFKLSKLGIGCLRKLPWTLLGGQALTQKVFVQLGFLIVNNLLLLMAAQCTADPPSLMASGGSSVL